jgi:hypothetical protein
LAYRSQADVLKKSKKKSGKKRLKAKKYEAKLQLALGRRHRGMLLMCSRVKGEGEMSEPARRLAWNLRGTPVIQRPLRGVLDSKF